jgi:hypothetical protein
MSFKSIISSTEIMFGAALIFCGIVAQIAGYHGIFAVGLAPFGVGLIIQDAVNRAIEAKREKSRIRIRHDDK